MTVCIQAIERRHSAMTEMNSNDTCKKLLCP